LVSRVTASRKSEIRAARFCSTNSTDISRGAQKLRGSRHELLAHSANLERLLVDAGVGSAADIVRAKQEASRTGVAAEGDPSDRGGVRLAGRCRNCQEQASDKA
jgi:hypothetical protein